MQKAAEIRKARQDISVWLETDAFECVNYLPKLGEFLFNSVYIILPVSELIRLKWVVYQWLAKDTKIFVRPSSDELLEANAFSTAALYACKMEPTVKRAGEIMENK